MLSAQRSMSFDLISLSRFLGPKLSSIYARVVNTRYMVHPGLALDQSAAIFIVFVRLIRGGDRKAKKWNADLIVVGSHGRRGFKRFLLVSVSEAVAMNAHCSVVVVRDPARSSRKARA